MIDEFAALRQKVTRLTEDNLVILRNMFPVTERDARAFLEAEGVDYSYALRADDPDECTQLILRIAHGHLRSIMRQMFAVLEHKAFSE